MADDEPKSERTANGQFATGNPGRKRKRELRADGLVNAFTAHGTRRDVRSYTKHRTKALRDTEAIDLRRGNWLARKICEWLPSDCFRKGYKLSLPGDKELAEKVMTVAESLQLNQRIVEAGQMERAAGGAALFPVIEGALGSLSSPLELDKSPRIVAVKAIHLLEPRELEPATWYQQLDHPKFRQPETYRVWPITSGTGASSPVTVHESRLVIFGGRRVSVEQLPDQRWGWGDNELTPVYEALYDYGMSWGSAATILRNFSQRVIKFKQLAEILKEEGGEALVTRRAEMMDMIANTLRILPLDAEDDLVNVASSVGGLADLLIELAQVVSAAAGMTMTRLFGRSAGGLNATGEHDQQIDHDTIANEQANKYTCRVEQLIRLIMLSTNGPTKGKEPPVWSIEWKPLKQQSEKEVAETRKLTAETDQINIDAGVYDARTAAESHYKGDTFSPDITINWAEWEKQNKIREEQAEAIAANPDDVKALGREGDVSEPAGDEEAGAEE